MQPQARRLTESHPVPPLRQAGTLTAMRSATPYRWTPVAIAVTCALTPAYAIRPHVGPVPTTVLELSLLATILIYAVERLRRREPVRWRSVWTLPVAVFLVAGAAAVLVSADHRAALGLYKAYVVEPALFFAVMVDSVRRAGHALGVLGGLALAGATAAVLNAGVVLQAALTHGLDLAVAAPVVIYNNANSVPLFLVPLIAVAGALAMRIGGWTRRIALAFLVLASLATILSFSRGGYLALAAVGFTLAAVHQRRRILVPVAVLLAAAFAMLPPVAHRLAHEFSASDPNNTLNSRLVLWRATLRMLRDHPIFGAGLSGFKQAIGPYRDGTFHEDLVYPHNLILNAWSEVGLIGLLAFLAILVLAFVAAVRAWRRLPEPWAALALGVFVALIAVVVHGLVDVPFWKNDLSVEFWALVGLPVAGLRWSRFASGPRSPG